jgi:hypothetical protein
MVSPSRNFIGSGSSILAITRLWQFWQSQATPLPGSYQVGVGLSDLHPKASQIGVGLSDLASIGVWFSWLRFRSLDLPMLRSPDSYGPSPLPGSSQLGVGLSDLHPKASQIGVGLVHHGTDWRRV